MAAAGEWGVRVVDWGPGLGVGVPAPKPAALLAWPALTFPKIMIPTTALIAGLMGMVVALDPIHPLTLRC